MQHSINCFFTRVGKKKMHRIRWRVKKTVESLFKSLVLCGAQSPVVISFPCSQAIFEVTLSANTGFNTTVKENASPGSFGELYFNPT